MIKISKKTKNKLFRLKINVPLVGGKVTKRSAIVDPVPVDDPLPGDTEPDFSDPTRPDNPGIPDDFDTPFR